jgi:hypothetical protein
VQVVPRPFADYARLPGGGGRRHGRPTFMPVHVEVLAAIMVALVAATVALTVPEGS